MTLRLNGSTSGYTEINAPAVAGSNTLVLPTGNGSANQILKNGSTAGSLAFGTATEDSSGNFAFNSGYGSVATAYGCRAWVNFNGTGTVAIRASGNVSSITDNGTGSYTVNLTTAMPDTSYCVQSCGVNGGVSNAFAFPEVSTSSAILVQTATRSAATTNADINGVYVAIFR